MTEKQINKICTEIEYIIGTRPSQIYSGATSLYEHIETIVSEWSESIKDIGVQQFRLVYGDGSEVIISDDAINIINAYDRGEI